MYHFNLVLYRSIKNIKTSLTDLREKIREVEHQFGSVDALREQLREKEEKYGVNIEFMSKLKQSCEVNVSSMVLRLNLTKIRDFFMMMHLYVAESHRTSKGSTEVVRGIEAGIWCLYTEVVQRCTCSKTI